MAARLQLGQFIKKPAPAFDMSDGGRRSNRVRMGLFRFLDGCLQGQSESAHCGGWGGLGGVALPILLNVVVGAFLSGRCKRNASVLLVDLFDADGNSATRTQAFNSFALRRVLDD